MADAAITLRLTLADPVPGVRYSLQKDDARLDPVTATDAPLSFDVPIRLSADNRVLGPFVRREGPMRRFVYIRIGQSAGIMPVRGRGAPRSTSTTSHRHCWTAPVTGLCWRSNCRDAARTEARPARRFTPCPAGKASSPSCKRHSGLGATPSTYEFRPLGSGFRYAAPE